MMHPGGATQGPEFSPSLEVLLLQAAPTHHNLALPPLTQPAHPLPAPQQVTPSLEVPLPASLRAAPPALAAVLERSRRLCESMYALEEAPQPPYATCSQVEELVAK